MAAHSNVLTCGRYYNRISYDRNLNKLELFAAIKIIHKTKNVLAYWDYDRSYDRNSVIVLATILKLRIADTTSSSIHWLHFG